MENYNREQACIESLFKKTKLAEIPVEKLEESELNTFSMKSIDEMKYSIQTYGLLTPLTVRETDGFYEVLSGNRRFRAIKELKEEGVLTYETVPCLCLLDENMSKAKRQLVVEVANLDTRKGVDETSHRFRVVECLKELVESGEEEERFIVKRLSEWLGTSERYAAMYKAIFENENKAVKEATESGKISVSDAARLSSMNEEVQQTAINQIMEADNKKAAKEIVKGLAKQEKEKKQREQGKAKEEPPMRESPFPTEPEDYDPSFVDNTDVSEEENGGFLPAEPIDHTENFQKVMDNVSDMGKEDIMKLFQSDGLGMGFEKEFDEAVSDIAATKSPVTYDPETFDYETFSDLIDDLLSKDVIETDTLEADAIHLCYKVVEKFSDKVSEF